MKKSIAFFLAIASLFAFTSSTSPVAYPELELGADAPLANRKMLDISNQQFSLNDLKKENGLIVIFSCNTCPFVLGWEDTYPYIGDLGIRNNIGVVLVNSNQGKRDNEDSLEEMQKHASEKNYNTPYVIDENSELANAFGAKTTPHVFFFNGDMKLIYKGSINNKYENENKKVTQWYLNEAIVENAAGKPVSNPSTRQIGCSIKRLAK